MNVVVLFFSKNRTKGNIFTTDCPRITNTACVHVLFLSIIILIQKVGDTLTKVNIQKCHQHESVNYRISLGISTFQGKIIIYKNIPLPSLKTTKRSPSLAIIRCSCGKTHLSLPSSAYNSKKFQLFAEKVFLNLMIQQEV